MTCANCGQPYTYDKHLGIMHVNTGSRFCYPTLTDKFKYVNYRKVVMPITGEDKRN